MGDIIEQKYSNKYQNRKKDSKKDPSASSLPALLLVEINMPTKRFFLLFGKDTDQCGILQPCIVEIQVLTVRIIGYLNR
jgi:hypothetical protein